MTFDQATAAVSTAPSATAASLTPQGLKLGDRAAKAAAADVVRVTGLTHAYGDKTALDDVSFAVGRGQIFALLGPNGGGKTTLFRILCTALAPKHGAAAIEGFDTVRDRTAVRLRIGVAFQSPSLDKQLTVRENLTYQGHMYSMSGEALRGRIDELLTQFRLADRAADKVLTLSGGMQRRIELAKALLHRPPVVILDEPSTGLDPIARRELMALLRDTRTNDGTTVLLTTHIMEEAEKCDRVAILDQGRLAAIDTPEALKATIHGDVVTIRAKNAGALGREIAERFAEPVGDIDGELRFEVDDGNALVANLMQAFPNNIDSATIAKPSLEDVFVAVTGHRFEPQRDGGAS